MTLVLVDSKNKQNASLLKGYPNSLTHAWIIKPILKQGPFKIVFTLLARHRVTSLCMERINLKI